jgi:hypothetical protein
MVPAGVQLHGRSAVLYTSATMLTRPYRLALGSIVLVLGFVCSASPLRARVDLPASLTDAEFWQLTEQLSEPNGYFRSDNFLSNEIGYQEVIPQLQERIRPGGVYMGVAPEINFTYIAALAPKMAFIVDIRRGNLHEHLLYKALFEMSTDRADFLSRLFSRKRPAGLNAASSVAELFDAYDQVTPAEPLFQENLASVLNWLTKHHRFSLRPDDPDGIEYVYREAFYKGGPSLDYSFGSQSGMGGRNTPTYEMLMEATDAAAKNHSFLADETTFKAVKDFESKNLLVPVVGDFAGPTAIRSIGKYVAEHGGTVVAFYLSNVEQYLVGEKWDAFCGNVATLPLNDTSTFIYSGRGAPGALSAGRPRGYMGRGPAGMGVSRTRLMQPETKSCAAR